MITTRRCRIQQLSGGFSGHQGTLPAPRHRPGTGSLYSNWDALVDAFVRREIDLAWNGPLAYVPNFKRRLEEPYQVVAMRDVDGCPTW